MNTLGGLLDKAADRFPERPAVCNAESGLTLTYKDFQRKAEAFSQVITGLPAANGNRIGICARKSVASLAAVFGTLKSGCAYVPAGYDSPADRLATIFDDCTVAAVAGERGIGERLSPHLKKLRVEKTMPIECLDGLDVPMELVVFSRANDDSRVPEHLSYILYTSGSTGVPKGVTHTHSSALSFIDWCSAEFCPTENDRFASHAPFHFDLSILDIFVAIKHGAMVVLIGEELGKQPQPLARAISDCGITVWYSTPSILRLIVEFGKVQQIDASKLRLVLFAGEVFPIKHLRALTEIWPHPTYYNLYGPTETNVCTYYRLATPLPDGIGDSIPIGAPCSGDDAGLFDEQGGAMSGDSPGELCISGGSVMTGYWGRADLDARVFFNGNDGSRWYRTGDICSRDAAMQYLYLSRRDRMVKRRGYRIELGEIEQALYRNASVSEAAVIARQEGDEGVRIEAHVAPKPGLQLSIIELKRHCGEALPKYMVPDRFFLVPELPKTTTHKVDYQRLVSGGA